MFLLICYGVSVGTPVLITDGLKDVFIFPTFASSY